jgi:hypothetical protein
MTTLIIILAFILLGLMFTKLAVALIYPLAVIIFVLLVVKLLLGILL